MENRDAESRSAEPGILISRRGCFAVPLLALGARPAAAGATVASEAGRAIRLVAGDGQATVATTAGQVRGYIRGGVFTFKGIPYGAPTGGANRFAAPVPSKPWTGTRSCLSYGPICPQPVERTLGGDEANFLTPRDSGFPDEDCLRLNVWSPTLESAAKLPVMVFLHGGRYTTGSSQSLMAYDGENLARLGEVVVITINHRLGVLGFLDLGHRDDRLRLSGNVGMLDIVGALMWVHENIHGFGGDPTRVTVFGQSGGAGKVAALLAMPSAKGLFHRAIAQSGPVLKLREPTVSQAMADELLRSLKFKTLDLDRLRELDLPTLIGAADEVVSKYQGPIFSPDLSSGHDTVGWAPVVDGQALIAHPFGPSVPMISADVPLIVGTTLNELGNNIDDPEGKNLSEQALRGRVKDLAGDRADAIIEAFRRRLPHATPADLWSRIASAPVRSMAIEQCSRKAAAGRAKTWLYWFAWQTPILDGRPGAFHTAELPFVFDNVERCDSITGGGAEAQRLAKQIAGAWTAFARTGDPNHAGLATWVPYDSARGSTMIFDIPSVARAAPDREELASFGPA
jgi:para-nitrobenzyl esterase